MRSIHASLLNLWVLAPVSPEEPPLERVQSYGAGLVYAVVDESLAHLAVEVGQLVRRGRVNHVRIQVLLTLSITIYYKNADLGYIRHS